MMMIGETTRDRARVALVMTAWNVAPWVGAAVSSVCEQTYRPLDLVFWDDGSVDGGATMGQARAAVEMALGRMEPERLDGFTFDCWSAPHNGRAGALSGALEVANRGGAAFVGLVDGDDRLRPLAVARCVDWLDRHPEAVAVYTNMALMDRRGVARESGDDRRPYGSDLLGFNSVHFLLWRRGAGADWAPRHEAAVDMDLFAHLRGKGEVGYLDEILYDKRRCRFGSMSSIHRRQQREAARAIRGATERMRS